MMSAGPANTHGGVGANKHRVLYVVHLGNKIVEPARYKIQGRQHIVFEPGSTAAGVNAPAIRASKRWDEKIDGQDGGLRPQPATEARRHAVMSVVKVSKGIVEVGDGRTLPTAESWLDFRKARTWCLPTKA